MQTEKPAEIASRIEQIRRELNKIDQTAEKISQSKSAYAVALLGGASGALVLGTVGHIADLTVAMSLLGIPIGAASGFLVWKGQEGLHHERSTEALSQSIHEMQADIHSLPADVPQEVKDTLWYQYVELQKQRTEVVKSFAQRRLRLGAKARPAAALSASTSLQETHINTVSSNRT